MVFFQFVFVLLSLSSVKPEVYVSTECYGNALSISCEAGHRIKVIDDFFGVSGPSVQSGGEDVCQYHPGDCTVTNNRYSSLIHRFCEGKGTCTNFQVDRRYCGLNHTNYEQVEYECVHDKQVLDMCSSISVSTEAAYLATPNFPNEYPASKDCMCTLWTSSEEAGIKLEATHFVVKYDRPCRDWVEIDSGRHKRRICGAYRSTILSDFFQVTFHSDNFQGHQGAWLRFSSYPETSNVTIHATCRPETYLPAKVLRAPPSATAVTSTSTITDPDLILSHKVNEEDTIANDKTTTEASDGSNEMNDTMSHGLDINLLTTKSAMLNLSESKNSVTLVEGIILNSDKNIVLGKPGQTVSKGESVGLPGLKIGEGNVQTKTPKEDYVKHRQSNRILKTKDNAPARMVRPTSAKASTPWHHKVLPEQEADPGIQGADPGIQGADPGIQGADPGIQGASFIVESIPKSSKKQHDGIIDEVPSLSNKQKVQSTDSDLSELLRTPFHSKHITGVIIISICVGGIIVLVVVLGVLVCVNRSKKPKRSLNRQRRHNDRLQERLNTLSFYDSIPLYDSIGHRGGGVSVARAPVPFMTGVEGSQAATDLDVGVSTISQPSNQPGFEPERRGPYWTSFHPAPLQEMEFDSSLYIDSSLYASLNRSFTSGERTRSRLVSASDIKSQDAPPPPPPLPPTLPQQLSQPMVGESDQETRNTAASVDISYHCEEEDICTHV